MTDQDAALHAVLAAVKARQDLIDVAVELLLARVEALEQEPTDAVSAVRLPKLRLVDINARLEGDDIA